MGAEDLNCASEMKKSLTSGQEQCAIILGNNGKYLGTMIKKEKKYQLVRNPRFFFFLISFLFNLEKVKFSESFLISFHIGDFYNLQKEDSNIQFHSYYED